MPTYDYRCTKGHVFELFHGISDDRAKRCPRCGSRARRVPSGGGGLLFKGSGFYITDYRSKSYKERARAEKPAVEGGGAKPSAGVDGGAKPSAGEGGGAKPSAGEGGGGKQPASSRGTAKPSTSGGKNKSSRGSGAGRAS